MGTVPAEKGEVRREARHYCLVREDLAPEQKMVMIGHAAPTKWIIDQLRKVRAMVRRNR